MPRLPEASSHSVRSREPVSFTFDGKAMGALVGEPVAAALLANGIRAIRAHGKSGRPRGIYCGIGQCFDCIATVDGVTGCRTCLTVVKEGMEVESESL
jgi:sarcosine oxidase subunit alpha